MPERAAVEESLVRDRQGSARRGMREIVLIVLSRWRVQAGFILGGAALAIAEPEREAIIRALPIVVAALALRAWARGHLERRKYLTRSGPYAYLRHPLYLGSFILGVVLASLASFPVAPAIFTLVFLIAYFPKAVREEAFLRARYGEEYRRYAREVGALLPRLRAVAAAPLVDSGGFRWRRVLAHGEWQTWIGTAVVFALLWARAE